MNKHMWILIVLVVLGVYWLVDHTAPLPFNHEQFGLFQHNIHRIIGVVLLVVAGGLWWKWRGKNS